MLLLTAAGEGMLLVIHLLSIPFLNPDLSVKTSTKLGWLIVVLTGLYILVNWIVVIAITVADMKGKYQAYKKKNAERKQKEADDKEYSKWKRKF